MHIYFFRYHLHVNNRKSVRHAKLVYWTGKFELKNDIISLNWKSIKKLRPLQLNYKSTQHKCIHSWVNCKNLYRAHREHQRHDLRVNHSIKPTEKVAHHITIQSIRVKHWRLQAHPLPQLYDSAFFVDFMNFLSSKLLNFLNHLWNFP